MANQEPKQPNETPKRRMNPKVACESKLLRPPPRRTPPKRPPGSPLIIERRSF